VAELPALGATTIVLSQGMDKQLQADPATLGYLAERFITVQVAQTGDAVQIYSELAGAAAVGGLFHSAS
jgi:hypothetical protein